MIIDKETMYLDKSSKAVLDAKNSILTQADLQSAIDRELKQTKPFVREINDELSCDIIVPDDIMVHKVIVETKSISIPRKIYIQHEGKQIEEDHLVKKFEFEWCKKYNIDNIKDLKIYINIEARKAYFVVNGSFSIIIDFE